MFTFVLVAVPILLVAILAAIIGLGPEMRRHFLNLENQLSRIERQLSDIKNRPSVS